MSDLNYSNYMYLFIDPHEIAITKQNLYISTPFSSVPDLHVDPSMDSPILQPATVFLQDNAENLDFKIIKDLSGLTGDAPPFNNGPATPIALERVQSPGVNSVSENMNVEEGLLGPEKSFLKKTNDVASPPSNKYRFALSDGKVEFMDRHGGPIGNLTNRFYISPLSYAVLAVDGFSSVLNQAKAASAAFYGGLGTSKTFNVSIPKYSPNANKIISFGSNIDTEFILQEQNNGPFKYRQKFYLIVHSPDAELIKLDTAENKISTFFDELYENIKDQVFGGYIMDCSTKIGVPYDFRTVIDAKAHEKAAGVVKTGQPTYESIYNYYDSQYEPVITNVLEAGSVTERSLPSLYDFLYFPIQNNLRAFIELPSQYNLPIDNVNLANINNYLDTFAKVFNKYGVDSNLNDLSTAAALNTYVSDELKSLDPNFKGPQYLFTNKSILMNALYASKKYLFGPGPNVISPELTTSSPAYYLAVSKDVNTPLWQEDVKSGFYFAEKSLNYFNQAKNYENTFPFYFKINIPVETKGPVAKLLSQNELLDSINTHAASLVLPNFEINDDLSTIGKFYGGLINGYKSNHFNLFNEIKLKTFNLHFTERPFSEDFNSVIPFTDSYGVEVIQEPAGSAMAVPDIPPDRTATQPPDYYESDLFLDTIDQIAMQTPKNVFIYSEEDLSNTPTGMHILLKQLKKQKFLNDLKNLFQDNKFFRTPKDIHDGKLAHQETLMYEIAKYKINDFGAENFVQSIFLPISDQNNLLYYDTQVEPYKKYFYKIFAHKVVVGTKYRPVPDAPTVENPNTLPNSINFISYHSSDNPGATVSPAAADKAIIRSEYEIQPYFKFIRVPYYNTEAVNISTDALNYSTIEDLPPLAPQVNIIPYKNINNKILILLNNSSGMLKAKHQSILARDDSIFINSYAAQGLDYTKADALLTFGGDDFGGTFEMFRTQNMPESYTDIENDTTLVRRRISMSDASVIDNISPNIDYYYTFRTVDVHEKLSNPTDIYKVRMVQQQGIAPYLKLKLINVAEEKLKQFKKNTSYTKSFKKYLRLKVLGEKAVLKTNGELLLNEQGFAMGDYELQSVSLGDASSTSPEGVFGKKYKMRVTSKQTGKKIDINFTVKNPNNIINKT